MESTGFQSAPLSIIDHALAMVDSDHEKLERFLLEFNGGNRLATAAATVDLPLERSLYLSHSFLDHGIFEEFRPAGGDSSGGRRIFALTPLGFDFQLLVAMHGEHRIATGGAA